jgi:hypothetical protein
VKSHTRAVGWFDLTNVPDETTNCQTRMPSPTSHGTTGPDRSGPVWADHGWYDRNQPFGLPSTAATWVTTCPSITGNCAPGLSSMRTVCVRPSRR